jgi:UDPglucose 6-dehydrogenase
MQPIGFIGQGWIGKNYADDFENRGYTVVRYALEEPYKNNKEKLKDCSIVLIAVPTPTTSEGFDDSILRDAVGNTAPGTIVVIKSTVLPGTTESIQQQFSDRTVVMSPEFLVESRAAYDAAHPVRNIIGIPVDNEAYREAAKKVLAVLPEAPFSLTCTSREAELIKYAGNMFLFTKVMFANLFFDIAGSLGADWEAVSTGLAADPRIGPSHLKVMDASRHPGAPIGRGAGGHCFIKDFKALRELYQQHNPGDTTGIALLQALETKNIELLTKSGKDIELLKGVYGDEAIKPFL